LEQIGRGGLWQKAKLMQTGVIERSRVGRKRKKVMLMSTLTVQEPFPQQIEFFMAQAKYIAYGGA
jgi:hypothetical protein